MHLAFCQKTAIYLRKRSFFRLPYRLYRSTVCTCAVPAVAYAAGPAQHEREMPDRSPIWLLLTGQGEVFAIGQGEKRPHGDEPRDLVAGEGQAKRNPAFV